MFGLVSIIVPCYNAGKYLSYTLDSILDQTYTNWEAIIIDDCSTDNSVSIINSYIVGDARFKLIESKVNSGGPAVPRNIGLDSALGDYIAFLDSDDLWLPEKLEHQLRFMSVNNVNLSCTSYELINEIGISSGKIVRSKRKMNFNKYLRNTTIGFSSTIVNRDLLNGIRFKRLPIAEDFSFWLDVLRDNRIMYGLDEVLTKYRIQKNSLSANKYKSAKQIWKIYRNTEKINFVKSVFYFNCYAFNALMKRL